MNYEIKNTEFDQNSSKENHLVNFLALSLGLCVGAIVLFVVFGVIANIFAKFIPVEAEYAIFGSKSKENPTKQEIYVQKLVDDLVGCSGIKKSLNVEIENSDVPNAMAIIGGRIVVNDGLFPYISSQNGLAFVLAHEISHFKNRDHLRSTILSGILTLLFGSNDNILIDIIQRLGFSKYSQNNEANADKSALEILNCHYGHVGGADEFFNEILKEDKGSSIFKIFDSHPATQKRIDAIKNSHYSKKDVVKLDSVIK